MRRDHCRSFVSTFALLGALVLSAGAANAADLYQGSGSMKDFAPAPIWTGLYVGGHVGGAWGNADVKDTNEYNAIDPHANVGLNKSGLFGGGQIGYNFQRGRIVYGLEADLGGMDLSGDRSVRLQETDVSKKQYWLNGKYSVSSGMYGDITGRLGYAEGRNLIYMKGGAAFLNVDAKGHYQGGSPGCKSSVGACNDPHIFAAQFDFGQDETMWGWTIGAGVERSLSSAWSLKAEYQHFDFGTMSYDYTGQKNHSYNNYYSGAISTLNGKTDISATADTVTFGLNYHIGR